jgi:hypothetical protein
VTWVPRKKRQDVSLFLEDLADHAGHTLDWTRSSHDRSNTVVIAAAHGDYASARAPLTVVAGGTTSIDPPVAVLNDLDKNVHAQAWARTGVVFETEQEKQTVTGKLRTRHPRRRRGAASAQQIPDARRHLRAAGHRSAAA